MLPKTEYLLFLRWKKKNIEPFYKEKAPIYFKGKFLLEISLQKTSCRTIIKIQNKAQVSQSLHKIMK